MPINTLRRVARATSLAAVIVAASGLLESIGLPLSAAVSNATINQILATSAAGEVTVAAMTQLPLLLVPAYLVPLFFIWHLTALFQARRVVLVEKSARRA